MILQVEVNLGLINEGRCSLADYQGQTSLSHGDGNITEEMTAKALRKQKEPFTRSETFFVL